MDIPLRPEGPPKGLRKETPPTIRQEVYGGRPEQIGELKREDVIRSAAEAKEVQDELATATPRQVQITDRQQILLGDFANTGRLEDNKLILRDDVAQELAGKAKDFVKSRRFIKPWYFFQGNKTATEYGSPFARNRSTQTAIRTLDGERKVFLIDPRGSTIHRISDTIFRRAFGHPARKVSVKEWKPLMFEKSEIPVLQQDGESGQELTFPYGSVVAVPYISNVNGVDYFANNKRIEFPDEYKWAKEAKLEDKMQVGEEAMRVAHDVHSRGKAWGEMATHNSLIVKKPDGNITVIPADTEVEYNSNIPATEKYARDIFDLTVTIAAGLNKSEGITGEGYDGVVSRLFGAYKNKEVIENVGKLVKPLSLKQRILYPIYEGLRYNGLPMKEYLRITKAMQKAALPAQSVANAS
ncbi:MAG: hypothetical protein HYV40_03865 [Candidatus Levybacteria bacterium]|nr:hypothetical protein [Candidatus Levybacteria bacterium]